jgi:hypothetical protein
MSDHTQTTMNRCSMQAVFVLLLCLMWTGPPLRIVSRSQRVRVTQAVRVTGVGGRGPLHVGAQQQQQQGAGSDAGWQAVQEVLLLLLLLPNAVAEVQCQLPLLRVQLQATAMSRVLQAVAALHKQQRLRQ